MENRIKDRYNQQILEQVMESFSITEDNIHMLDGFESFIYEFQQEGQAYILRISHSLRRDENLIWGEIDWINYLHRGGACVAKAITAKSEGYVVPVPDAHGGHFLAAAFVKANGYDSLDEVTVQYDEDTKTIELVRKMISDRENRLNSLGLEAQSTIRQMDKDNENLKALDENKCYACDREFDKAPDVKKLLDLGDTIKMARESVDDIEAERNTLKVELVKLNKKEGIFVDTLEILSNLRAKSKRFQQLLDEVSADNSQEIKSLV